MPFNNPKRDRNGRFAGSGSSGGGLARGGLSRMTGGARVVITQRQKIGAAHESYSNRQARQALRPTPRNMPKIRSLNRRAGVLDHRLGLSQPTQRITRSGTGRVTGVTGRSSPVQYSRPRRRT